MASDQNDNFVKKEPSGRGETHKLDILAENSALKVRLASAEREHQLLADKLDRANSRLDELQGRLNDRTMELTEMRARTLRNGTLGSDLSDAEVEKLKKAVESLMAVNDEKDQHIEGLRKRLHGYQKLDTFFISPEGHKVLQQFGLAEESLHNSSFSSNTSSPRHTKEGSRTKTLDQSPLRTLSSNFTTSTPVTVVPPDVSDSPAILSHKAMYRSTSAERLPPRPQRNQLAQQRETAGTLPREMERTQNSSLPRKKGDNEDEALKDEMAQQYRALREGGPEHRKSKRGLKRFLGRLKRSGSQSMEEDAPGDFKRNGLRSTAGPRLGWSREVNNSDVPFARWDTDRVVSWLHALGLTMYISECRRWIKNGEQLLQATPTDLEKELGVRNLLHRKKLQLALQAIGSDSNSHMDQLDHNWVTRWLDDIGLPQYKDHFYEARVDGRVLNYLTVDDLVDLRVSSTLHHLSIRSAVLALRLVNFDHGALKRRPIPDQGPLSNCPQEVFLWTNHRVMEWLRTIDFSEYAPNLRGSGVHGALMVLEPRFSAELFASMLLIPSSKTLLRRHLSTHFVTLVGSKTQHLKRSAQSQPNFVPLTPNQKVKVKRGLFSHKRTRSNDFEDYLVPLDLKAEVPGLETQKKSKELTKTELQSLSKMFSKQQFMEDVPTSDV